MWTNSNSWDRKNNSLTMWLLWTAVWEGWKKSDESFRVTDSWMLFVMEVMQSSTQPQHPSVSIWGVFQPLQHFRRSDGQLLWLTLLYGHSSLFFTSPVHISPPTPQTVNSIRFTNSKNATPSVATEVLLFPHAARLVIKHVYSFFISLPVFPFIQFPSPVCRLR